MPQARTTIWLYRIPSLIGAIGAVLLTYWAALAFVSRRTAYLAGLMMATSVLLDRRGAPRQDRRDAAVVLRRRHGRDGARLSRAVDRTATFGWGHALILWTALAAGILLKGPLILMVVGLAAVALAIADRSARWLLRLRPLVGVLWMLLLVLPWFVAIMARAGDSFLQESVGQDLLGEDLQGAGNPRRAARLLSAAVLADVLAGRAARRDRGAGGVAAAPRAADALPARLARAELDRVRAGGHQAAALRAAALSGDRDPDRARDRARARCRTMRISSRFNVMWPIFAAVLPAGRDHRPDLRARAVRLARLAVRGGLGDLRLLRLAPLRRGGRGALVRARQHRRAVHVRRGARRRRAADAAGVPEPRARRADRRQRLPQSGGRERPASTSRAWCSWSARARDWSTARRPPKSCARASAASR